MYDFAECRRQDELVINPQHNGPFGAIDKRSEALKKCLRDHGAAETVANALRINFPVRDASGAMQYDSPLIGIGVCAFQSVQFV